MNKLLKKISVISAVSVFALAACTSAQEASSEKSGESTTTESSESTTPAPTVERTKGLNLAIVDEAPYAATTVVNGAECSMPEVKMSVQDAEGNELVAPEYGMPGRVIGEGDAAKCSILVTVDEVAGKDAYKVVLTDASGAVVAESDVDAVNRNFITVDLKF